MEVLTDNNYYASEKDCEDLFSKLHEKIYEKLVADEYLDFKQLADDWELLRKVYKENSRGPAKNDIAERVGTVKLAEDSEQFVFMMKQASEKELQESHQKLVVAQGLFDNAKDMLKDEKEKYTLLFTEFRQKGQEERLEYERRIDELKAELNKKDDQIRRLEFDIEKQSKLA